ncbi:protein kinase, cAMP-dependent, regulatory, type II, alpha, B isoform X2 [Entelurus aequoreus]|uniref:protein kinase, cAMP-dependent, regulatory, type II, alpha, B isoform X2 n=1 Tax=Entelurus aequoreus TaxID=161455 RepID=UPI002B1E0433|nr:protein kinase, cAMP-dependent, regulatory, type II, alpha, B isoform X2 [Entelurus aequoreus]
MSTTDIPAGLRELLQKYTVEVLRHRPANLVEFAVQHFTQILQGQSNHKRGSKTARKGVTFATYDSGPENKEEEKKEEEPVNSTKYNRRVSVCAEAYDPDDDEEGDSESRVVHPKTDEQRRRLQEACRDILLFKTLEQFSEVLDAMFEVQVKAQEHIIDQGDDGDNFYVIEKGEYDILVEKEGVSVRVGKYDNKGSFGELALMYNTPRAATIVATQAGALWGLVGDDLHVCTGAPAGDVNYFLCALPGQSHLPPADGEEQRQEEEDVRGLRGMCSSAQVFGALGENEDRGRVGSTKLQRWRAHHRAGNTSVSSEWTPCGHVTSLWHSQGDMADCFYIVETGQVRIMIKSKTNAGQQDQAEVEVARCSQGQYFGELALVTNKPRAASVYAVGHTKCLVIDIQAFERLLGPCKEILKRNISQYEEQLVALFGSSVDLKH